MVDPKKPSEPLEDPKTLAKTMLQEGADIEAIIAETSLSKPAILGLKGSLVKAQKKLDKAAKGNPEEETDLNTDLKREAQTTNNMVVLARGKARLKALDPGAYREHYGPPEQAETSSPSKIMTDLELSRYIRTLRESESHPNNGESSQGMLELQRQITDLKTEMHKKDVENLRDENAKIKEELKEIRSDMRHSNSNSDLAVVVKEASSLLEKLVTSDGPLRQYLTPNASIPIKPVADAPPLLQGQPVETRLFETLKAHGLTTHIIERRPS